MSEWTFRLTLAGIIVLMAVTSAVLCIVAWMATLEVWHLALASFINGCGYFFGFEEAATCLAAGLPSI